MLDLADSRPRWFDLRADRELEIDADGVLRSCVFPRLWIDTKAVLANDLTRALATLEQGLSTSEHAEFVQRLKAAGEASG